MNYSDIEMRRIGVDPKAWNWFNKDYSRHQVMDPAPVSYELKRVTRMHPKRFIVFLIPFLILVGFNSGGQLGVGSFILTSLAILIPIMCMSRAVWMKIVGFILVALGLVIGGVAVLRAGQPLIFLLMLVGLGIHFGIARLFLWSFYDDGMMMERANALHGAELWSDPSQRVYGNPGSVASAVNKFGKEAVDAGVAGEEKTAILLCLLLKIPGVTVFHGLKFPGSANADVDHAVVHGSNVYLIDSKMYRWGTYEWRTDPKYGERITASNGFGRSNHMDAAAEKYRMILGPGVNIIPIILFHGKNVKIGEKKWSSTGVGLFTPDEAMRFMGETISYDMRAWQDNMSVRAGLLQNMKR